MGNMNVRARLDRISKDLTAVVKYIEQYHGVSRDEAVMTDNDATNIAEQAARICQAARLATGDRSATKVVRAVRKALGFTYP